MGSITVQLVGDGTVGTKTKTYVVSDADVNRLVAYAKSLVGGNPTVAQAASAYADAILTLTKTNIFQYEQGVAANAISPIVAT